jgi:UDP-glucuronate 4-epimerase
MAYWSFAQRLRRSEPLQLFGRGELRRDFTYIDDVTDALVRLVVRGAPPVDAEGVPSALFNVGHQHPVRVIDFVRQLEAVLGCPAQIEFAPLQAGDVPDTCADPSRLIAAIGPWRRTPLHDGLSAFAQWLQRWDALPRPLRAAA